MALFVASWIVVGFLILVVGLFSVFLSDSPKTGTEAIVLMFLFLGGWVSLVLIFIVGASITLKMGYSDAKK